MKEWRRAAGLAPLIGLLVALAVVGNRGQALSRQIPACTVQQPWTTPGTVAGEPPLADSPAPPQPPVSPAPPFVAPPPNPFTPNEEPPPYGGMPFVGPEPMEPAEPLVRLRVRAPAEVQPGKEIEYHLTVENVSRAAAHHVIVRDRLPRGTDYVRAKPEPTSKTPAKAGVTDLLWDFATLKPGEQKVIVLAINPTGSDEIQNSAYVQFEHGQTVKTRIAKASVGVRVIAPAQTTLYQAIAFRLEVTNTGPAPAKDVVLTDELPAGLEFLDGKPYPKPEKPLTWKLGELAPGQTRRIDYQAMSRQAGTFTNKAEVTAAGGVRQKGNASVTVGEAKLTLIKTGPQRRLINRPTPYQITVRNSGTMPATNVQVIDELTPDIKFLSASPGGRFADGRVRWSLGTLPPAEQRVFQVVLLAPRAGDFGNAVHVTADHDVSVKARAEATHFETPAGPTIEIDKSADPVEVGQKTTYTIRLINPGKTAFLSPIVSITVPEAMTVRGERGPTTAQREGAIVRFDALPALEAGAEVVYTIEVEAKKAGEARLRVELTEKRKDLGPPQVWEEKTLIREAPRLAPQAVPPTLQVRQTHRR